MGVRGLGGGVDCTMGAFTGGCWNAGAITAPQIFTGDVVITASKSVPNNEAALLVVVTAGEI